MVVKLEKKLFEVIKSLFFPIAVILFVPRKLDFSYISCKKISLCSIHFALLVSVPATHFGKIGINFRLNRKMII